MISLRVFRSVSASSTALFLLQPPIELHLNIHFRPRKNTSVLIAILKYTPIQGILCCFIILG